MYGLLSVMFAELVRSGCLDSATLTGLGLSPVSTPFTPASANNTYCSDMIKAGSKFCVNDTAFAKPVTEQKISATQAEKSALVSAASSYLTNYNTLMGICSNNITTANVGKKINANITITNDMVWRCGNFSSILTTVNTVAASIAGSAASVYSTCYDFFWTTTNGAFCALATDAATNYTTVTGNTVTFSASTGTANRAYTACKSLYFATCLANDVASFLDTIVGGTATASATVSQACGSTTQMATYVNGTATCPDGVQQALYKQFFTPSKLTIGSSIPTTIAASLSTFKTATIARLLQLVSNAVTVTTVYTTSSSGYSVDTSNTGLGFNSSSTNSSSTNSTTQNSGYLVAPFLMALFALFIN